MSFSVIRFRILHVRPNYFDRYKIFSLSTYLIHHAVREKRDTMHFLHRQSCLKLASENSVKKSHEISLLIRRAFVSSAGAFLIHEFKRLPRRQYVVVFVSTVSYTLK